MKPSDDVNLDSTSEGSFDQEGNHGSSSDNGDSHAKPMFKFHTNRDGALLPLLASSQGFLQMLQRMTKHPR